MLRFIPLICLVAIISNMMYLRYRLSLANIQSWALPSDDSAQGWLGRAYQYMLASFVILILIEALLPGRVAHFTGTIPFATRPVYSAFGCLILMVGSAVIIWGQQSLGLSWRIGIPVESEPDLITSGAFRYSRNPVYLGIFLAVSGFVLIYANTVSAMLFAAVFIAIHVQVREEERFLSQKLGTNYTNWLSSSNRWFGISGFKTKR